MVVGVALPSEVNHGAALTVNGKIYLIGGRNSSDQNINQVLCFDPSTNQWSAKANMPTARYGLNLVWFENRIWAIGGRIPDMSKVESYNPITDSWQTEVSLSIERYYLVSWIANGRIYSGGGVSGSSRLSSIETYNPTTKQWSSGGNFPENKYVADAVVLDDKVYVIGGSPNKWSTPTKSSPPICPPPWRASMTYTARMAMPPRVRLIVQAEVADGSVTTAKMADGAITITKIQTSITTSQLNEYHALSLRLLLSLIANCL